MNRVRTPVAAMLNADGDMVVITDDGAVFGSGHGREWFQLRPIPGTIEAQIQAEPAEPAGCTEARD